MIFIKVIKRSKNMKSANKHWYWLCMEYKNGEIPGVGFIILSVVEMEGDTERWDAQKNESP